MLLYVILLIEEDTMNGTRQWEKLLDIEEVSWQGRGGILPTFAAFLLET